MPPLSLRFLLTSLFASLSKALILTPLWLTCLRQHPSLILRATPMSFICVLTHKPPPWTPPSTFLPIQDGAHGVIVFLPLVLTVHHPIAGLMWSNRGWHTAIPAGETIALVGAAFQSLRDLSCARRSQMEAIGWSESIGFDMVWLLFDIFCLEIVFALFREWIISIWNMFQKKNLKWLAFLVFGIAG